MKKDALSDLGLDAALKSDIFLAVSGAELSATRAHGTKISVVGTGNVGMAIAQTILTQDLADELALYDANADKLRGEMLDLQHAAAFLPRVNIVAEPDLAITAGSDLVIIAAGARVRSTDRDELIRHNVEVFQGIVPTVAELSPDAILIVVSNPVDVMAYVAWKLSKFPAYRVIGSGTNLDSSRFRFLLADHLEINAQDIQAYMIGEHGDNCVHLLSSIGINGVPLLLYTQESSEEFESNTLESIRKSVVDSVHEVLRLKGYTSWAIGYSVANLAFSLLRDQRRIHPVSVLAKGMYNIGNDQDIFLSLPAQLGRVGVVSIAQFHLTEDEETRLQESVDRLSEDLDSLML